MTRCTRTCLSDDDMDQEPHEHLGLQPPLIEPMPVGPGLPVGAGLEPALALDDAAEAVGVVSAGVDALGCVAVGDAAVWVTVGGEDPAARCDAAEWRGFARWPACARVRACDLTV